MRMNHDLVTVRDRPKRKVPPKADRSLFDMLRWCGVEERRALDIVADAHSPEGAMLLHETLGQDVKVCTVGDELCFNARLGPASWNGRQLRTKVGEIPDTLTDAMTGRRLVDVVDHDALPRNRTIASARLDDGVLTLTTAGEVIEPTAPRGSLAGSAMATRRLIRTRRRHLRSASKDAWSMATVQAGVAITVAFGIQLAIALTFFHDTRVASAMAILATMLAVSLVAGVIQLYLCVKASPRDLRGDHDARMAIATADMRSRWGSVAT
jgi:hypothetical protein